MDGSTSAYSESATADALEAFRSLSSSGFGASGNGASGSSSASSSNGASSATRTAAAAAGSAAAGLAAAAQPVNIPKGCLITKWSAVWLVHADRSRSHVGYPTPGCESSAFPITADDGLGAFPKAHGGVGAYFLDEAKSREACKLFACDANGRPAASSPALSARAAASLAANGQTPQAAAATPKLMHPMVPLLGWGVGVSSGGAWMARTTLRFNGPAKRSFPQLDLAPGEPLLLVFGGASVTDMLKNWVLHVQRVRDGSGRGLPFVVACMDEKLFGLAESQGYPAVLMAEDTGGESTVATRWKYYRMDPKAFLAMGILKVPLHPPFYAHLLPPDPVFYPVVYPLFYPAFYPVFYPPDPLYTFQRLSALPTIPTSYPSYPAYPAFPSCPSCPSYPSLTRCASSWSLCARASTCCAPTWT